MKKLFSLFLVLVITAAFFTACNVTNPSTDTDSTYDEVDIMEQLALEDKNYDRVIYLREGETYNLYQQYRYENLTVDPTSIAADKEAFTISDGVITAGESADIVSASIDVAIGDGSESVMIRVLNRDKYGDALSTVDAGLLYGKSVMFFGDSITHNWAKYPSGDREQENDTTSLGYNHIPKLHEFCHFSKIVNAAWSGGTISYLPSDDERFTYKSLPGSVDDHIEDIKEAEIIFIFYGTNDLYDQIPIGEATDAMTTDGVTDYSFYAGLNYGLTNIRKTNPDALIIVMTIMARDPINFGDISIVDYNNALQVGAEAYKAKILNTFKLFRSNDLKDNFNDGLHPNDTGYNRITEYILKDNKTVDVGRR